MLDKFVGLRRGGTGSEVKPAVVGRLYSHAIMPVRKPKVSEVVSPQEGEARLGCLSEGGEGVVGC